ncbi:hypothetical protein D3C84_1238100 [compost metagenome]
MFLASFYYRPTDHPADQVGAATPFPAPVAETNSVATADTSAEVPSVFFPLVFVAVAI